jgi:ribosome-associated toxin RatA of RatAB toxin-antitoxin module
MASIRKSALVPYACERMFDLVSDVDAYPQFLPWCSSSQVRPAAAGSPDNSVDARVDVDFYGAKLSFTTRNRQQPPSRIDMAYLNGPFREFNGCWRFHALGGEACKIEFSLDYLMNAGVLGGALAPIFAQIASNMVDAFVKRADQIYG